MSKTKIKKKIKAKVKAKPKPKAKVKAKSKGPKVVGVVTHYYGKLEVAIVKFKVPFKVGEEVHFKGATTDFIEKIKSMQYDHREIKAAKKGQEVGIKVNEKVREGDEALEVI